MFTFLLIFGLANAAYPQINEVFVSNYGKIEENSEIFETFLELYVPGESFEEVSVVVEDYGLLFIANQPPRIIEYIDLQNASLYVNTEQNQNHNFFVISNSYYTPNLAAHYKRLKLTCDEQVIIVLMRNPDPVDVFKLRFNVDLTISFVTEEGEINAENIPVIQKLAVDAVVVRCSLCLENDDWVREIFPAYIGFPVEIQIGKSESEIFSINHCPTPEFSSLSWWYAPITPGEKNYCDPPFHEAIKERIEYDFDEEEIVPDINYSLTEELNHAELLREAQKNGHVVNRPLLDFLKFNLEARYFKYIKDYQDPSSGRILCSSCNTILTLPVDSPYYKKIHKMSISDVMMDGLTFKAEAWETLRKLKEHLNSKAHKDLMVNYNAFKANARTPTTVEPDSGVIQEQAEKIIGLTLLEMKVGVSLKKYPDLINGLNQLGCSFRDTHVSSRSARRLVSHISHYIHNEIINHIVENESPFALLADLSTDVGGRHGLLLYFMLVKEESVEVKMWSYVEAKESTGAAIFEIVKELIENEANDGFKLAFKKQITALATDGASNMFETYSSFGTLLSQYVSDSRVGNLPKYHCSNHRISLAYNDVMYNTNPNLEFCRRMIQQCNKLALFYSTKSYRKRNELKDTAVSLNEKIRFFKRMERVKWVQSSQESYSVINLNYKTFTTHLENIVAGPEAINHPTESRQQAENLYVAFTDRNLLSNMFFTMDLIYSVSRWSIWLERSKSNIIDLNEWRTNCQLEMEALLAVDGKNLEDYLNETGTSTLMEYEAANDLSFRDVKLGTSSDFPPLSQTRVHLVNAMLDALERRFPETAVSAFSVLYPANLETSTLQQWNALATFLNNHYSVPPHVQNDLMILKDSLLESEFHKLYKNSAPEEYWEKVLKEFPLLQEDTKKIIRISLLQPASIAKVEGGFSILKQIKPKEKSMMSAKTAKELMDVRYNSGNLATFPIADCAAKWLASGSTRSVAQRKKCFRRSFNYS